MKRKLRIKSVSLNLASPEQIRGSRPWKIDEDGICAETWLDRKEDHGWSYGEVTKPETINYKTFKPDRGGLFDEVIFGPEKDFECSCGKYKKEKYAGKVCEKCGVEVIESFVRRDRMGHIELAAPVAHIWMAKDSPAAPKIGLVLDLKAKEVESIVYYSSYIVVSAPKNSEFKEKEIVNLADSNSNSRSIRIKLRKILEVIKKQYASRQSFDYKLASEYYDKLKDSNSLLSIDDVFEFVYKHKKIKFMTGAEALQILLKNIDLRSEREKIRDELKNVKEGEQRFSTLLRRLEMVNLFIKNPTVKPEYMIMNVLPVTPPDTRPIVQLDGGAFTTSDINNLYRKIIVRNDRLRKVLEINAPAIIVNNEKRLLQDAVDALFDNSSKKASFQAKEKRPLKSLTDHLGGKSGIFRKNLLGKRVDFSARTVIVGNPTLKLYEVGLPIEVALKLYTPFIISELIKKSVDETGNEVQLAASTKDAEKMIANQDDSIWPILQEVVKERPVLLNRPPSLHKLSIQAFEVKLVEGKAIQINPIVCEAFNADFDGDAMAVHLPLSDEAIAEARKEMLASWHIIGPKDGKPVVTPRQDMVFGLYAYTREEKGLKGEGLIFSSVEEVQLALDNKEVEYNSIVGISAEAFAKDNLEEGKILLTTPGKIILNSVLPVDLDYVNNSDFTIEDSDYVSKDIEKEIKDRKSPGGFAKGVLSGIISRLHKNYQVEEIGKYIDNIKSLGFKYATLAAGTISALDLPKYDSKHEYIKAAEKTVALIKKQYEKGLLTDDERYVNVIKTWMDVRDKVATDMKKIIDEKENVANPVVTMIKSGARGNAAQFTSLLGMRGLMNKSYNYEKAAKVKVVKDTIETPIKHSLIEGVSSLEFFNSSYGSRKASSDIQLKTPKSGYMTRQLVDCAQEIVVTESDCGTNSGLKVTAMVNADGQVIEKLGDRIKGRYAFDDVKHDGKVIITKDTMITDEMAKEVDKLGIKEVEIRSILHCKCKHGVCQKCFGADLTTKELVRIGQPVGVIAGQSIGEPSTQINLRSKQTGGLVGGGGNIAQGFERLRQLLEVVPPKDNELAQIAPFDAKVTAIEHDPIINAYSVTLESLNNNDTVQIYSDKNVNINVKKGQEIECGYKVFKGSINLRDLLKYCGMEALRAYLITELQNIYRIQGIEINDKYFEIIVSQMTNKFKVKNPNDSETSFTGEVLSANKLAEINKKLLLNDKTPVNAEPCLFGVKDVPDQSDSFLSSASFQYSKQVLAQACISGERDHLRGLKENVMLGNLIPAGFGLKTSEEVIREGEIAKRKEW